MELRTTILLVACALAFAMSPPTDGAKILAIFPCPGPSQYILVQPLLKALAGRGHEVTVINAFPQKQPIANFRDVYVPMVFENFDEIMKNASRVNSTVNSKWSNLVYAEEWYNHIILAVLNNAGVQRLLQPASNEHFDLVIVETLFFDPLYAIADHFGAPKIGLSSFGTDRVIDELVGNVSPLSYIASPTVAYGERMTFWQRLYNTVDAMLEFGHLHLFHLPRSIAIYRQYFPHAKQDLLVLRRNFSLILLNQHHTLSFPRPYVPNMIEVGGLHLSHKLSPLPPDMAAFIDGATDGVIYFSMGSNGKSKDLPPATIDALLQVFAALPQRVLWKFEQTELPGKPDNVYISHWFPQPDILAHPKVRLFITHGGLLSTIEAIYHGKPVIGIPVCYDQFLNVERATQAGYGLGISLATLSAGTLRASIERVLGEPSFAATAARMSRLYHDQPMTPLDTAIYWTEYVLRHGGAPHLRNAAQDMNFVQYHGLDTIGVLVGGLCLTLFLLLWVPLKLIRWLSIRVEHRRNTIDVRYRKYYRKQTSMYEKPWSQTIDV